MNEMYMVHMFMCVIFMFLMATNCTQKFCSTRYKQYNQSHPNHDKILTSKCIWSYLSRYSPVFDSPGSEIDGIMCVIQGV
jgi:hypothetical protein